ncbi:hypothetical protein PINS_up017502 [Pythium insidiosum]|nr:hypothetical protein PINS_up017502 [Pythium insidiosum]
MDADVGAVVAADVGAVVAAVTAVCVAAVTVAVDQRALRREATNTSTYPTRTFEEAMAAPATNWFHTKLRCSKTFFREIYALVRGACTKLPAPNSKHKLIKRLALTMLYLAQSGTIDEAATVLGIPRSRAVTYISEILDILCVLDYPSISYQASILSMTQVTRSGAISSPLIQKLKQNSTLGNAATTERIQRLESSSRARSAGSGIGFGSYWVKASAKPLSAAAN